MDSVGCDKVYSRKQIKSIDIKTIDSQFILHKVHDVGLQKRKHLLYFATSVLTENLTAELIQEHDKPTIKAL
jgi:hypothetical protein